MCLPTTFQVYCLYILKRHSCDKVDNLNLSSQMTFSWQSCSKTLCVFQVLSKSVALHLSQKYHLRGGAQSVNIVMRMSFSKCIGNILGKYLEDTSSFAGTLSRKCHLRGEAQSINSVMRMSFSKCIGNRLGKYLEDASSFAATLSRKCHLRGNFFCNFVPKMFYPKIFCSQY